MPTYFVTMVVCASSLGPTVKYQLNVATATMVIKVLAKIRVREAWGKDCLGSVRTTKKRSR